jgi:hypothetical protein
MDFTLRIGAEDAGDRFDRITLGQRQGRSEPLLWLLQQLWQLSAACRCSARSPAVLAQRRDASLSAKLSPEERETYGKTE